SANGNETFEYRFSYIFQSNFEMALKNDTKAEHVNCLFCEYYLVIL
ncbi:7467_t:CDS:1, partial [Gigaspora rosea]